jgi:gas vesicle protein
MNTPTKEQTLKEKIEVLVEHERTGRPIESMCFNGTWKTETNPLEAAYSYSIIRVQPAPPEIPTNTADLVQDLHKHLKDTRIESIESDDARGNRLAVRILSPAHDPWTDSVARRVVALLRRLRSTEPTALNESQYRDKLECMRKEIHQWIAAYSDRQKDLINAKNEAHTWEQRYNEQTKLLAEVLPKTKTNLPDAVESWRNELNRWITAYREQHEVNHKLVAENEALKAAAKKAEEDRYRSQT